MNHTEKDDSRTIEWSFRVGIPVLAWVAVFAFFAFADSVSPHEPVTAIDGRATVPVGADPVATRPSLGHEQRRTEDPDTGEPAATQRRFASSGERRPPCDALTPDAMPASAEGLPP
jgi:hypothetical protein